MFASSGCRPPSLPGLRPNVESQSDAGRKDIDLQSVKLAGKQLSKEQYQRTDKKLIIKDPPSGSFDAEIEVQIKPQVGYSTSCAPKQCLSEDPNIT